MAHWDYSEETRPCICGAGELTICCETENYPPGRVRTNVKVKCEHCQATYYVTKYGFGPITYSKRSDIATRVAALDARSGAWNRDPDVGATRERLRLKLDTLPSLAARWRWLRERQLYASCLSIFRREYQAEPARLVAGMVLFHRHRFPTLDDASAKREAFTLPEIPVFEVSEPTDEKARHAAEGRTL